MTHLLIQTVTGSTYRGKDIDVAPEEMSEFKYDVADMFSEKAIEIGLENGRTKMFNLANIVYVEIIND